MTAGRCWFVEHRMRGGVVLALVALGCNRDQGKPAPANGQALVASAPGKVRLLDEKAYLATFTDPMRDVSERDDSAVDIWPYVRAVAAADLRGFTLEEGVVANVYRSGDDRFDHVSISTKTANVYLVVVVSRPERAVYGHYLLNLNEKYGLPTPGR